MTQPTDSPLVFPIVKASLTLATVLLASSATVYGLLAGVFGLSQQAGDSLIGAMVCLLIGLSGFVPVWRMSRKSAYGSAYGFLVSILVRCVVGGAAVAWLHYGGVAGAETVVMWVAGWYLLVLGVEVKLISSHVLAATKVSGPVMETN
jgi:hypothetical protein